MNLHDSEFESFLPLLGSPWLGIYMVSPKTQLPKWKYLVNNFNIQISPCYCYLLCRPIPPGRMWYRGAACRTAETAKLSVAITAYEVAIVALVDVAYRQGQTNWTPVDLLQVLLTDLCCTVWSGRAFVSHFRRPYGLYNVIGTHGKGNGTADRI